MPGAAVCDGVDALQAQGAEALDRAAEGGLRDAGQVFAELAQRGRFEGTQSDLHCQPAYKNQKYHFGVVQPSVKLTNALNY